MNSRLAPPSPTKKRTGKQLEFFPGLDPNSRDIYQLTEQRLKEIREEKMYPFYDKDTEGGRGDLVHEIHDNSVQVQKQLNFRLPFFGFGFNYTWVRYL